MKTIYVICIWLFLCLTTLAAHRADAQEIALYNFLGIPDGANPEGSLTSYNGKLYGVTAAGGTANAGTVFELSPNGAGGWNEAVLYNFCSRANCTDGSTPTYAYVTFDSRGNMYGTTWTGGAKNDGVVWKLTPSGAHWKETILHVFQSGNGVSGLVMDSFGNLYGCTYNGPGSSSVFELSPLNGRWTYRTIYNIDETYAGLTIDPAGNLFGSTLGYVFELSPNGSGGWDGSVLYNFEPDKDGEFEIPTLDSAGNLYGTTESGGLKDSGAVWRLSRVKSGKEKGTWTERTLYSFKGGQKDGSFPYPGIVFDNAGNIYGTTLSGGFDERGTVFELVAPIPPSEVYKERLLWSFNVTDGPSYGGLVLDSSGNLYGATYGSSDSAGVVFEVNPAAAATTITLSPSSNPSTEGEAVTFTALITPAPPDGETITFVKGTMPEIVLGTGTLSGGVATLSYSGLPVGTASITAVYGGNLAFGGSTSNTVKQVVDK